MSIFDVLKYQNTNINDYDALMELPEDLINQYWEMVLDKVPNWFDTHNLKCAKLAHYAECYGIDQYNNYLKIFNEVLKNYEPV